MSKFIFYTKLDLTSLLGVKAKNIREMLEFLKQVPDSSIYFHTHRFLQQHHYLSPEPPNDFAYWIREVLNDEILAEQLASIDVIQFHSISDFRKNITETMSSHLASVEKITDCPAGQEFHFMASQTFAFPTLYTASGLKEFRENLEQVSINSLYYHIFDAKLRLAQDENDFSEWFRDINEPELAEEVKKLDPYTYTLEGLRKRITVMVRKYDKN